MKNLPRIIGFVAIATLGFFSVSLVVILALKLGLVAALPADEHVPGFRMYYMAGGILAWAAATLVGITNFFLTGAARVLTFIMPLAVPALYCIGVLVYFTNL